jgi:hypothetical protein
MAHFFLPCPKITRIQTPKCWFLLVLSKYYPDSDSKVLIPSRPVQIIPRFGLHMAHFFLPCPNITRIQTPKCWFLLVLSEYYLDSDYQTLFLSSSVRITPGFRLRNASVNNRNAFTRKNINFLLIIHSYSVLFLTISSEPRYSILTILRFSTILSSDNCLRY